MKLIHHHSDSAQSITGHGPGFVILNGERIDKSLVVSPTRSLRVWAESFELLTAEHFAQLLVLQPELVLLGTGSVFRFPSPALTRPLLEAGIGVECMDTAAACRTYTVLASEDRQVVAALIIP